MAEIYHSLEVTGNSLWILVTYHPIIQLLVQKYALPCKYLQFPDTHGTDPWGVVKSEWSGLELTHLPLEGETEEGVFHVHKFCGRASVMDSAVSMVIVGMSTNRFKLERPFECLGTTKMSMACFEILFFQSLG